MLVADARTLEVRRSKPPLPAQADGSVAPELFALLEQVALTGEPRHRAELRHAAPGREPSWWSVGARRVDDDGGAVVVAVAVERTAEIRARDVLGARDARRRALLEAIGAVSARDLVAGLQRVTDALVAALAVDVAALRLLDADGGLHLVAASGLRPAETRRLALRPIRAGRHEGTRPPSALPSLGLQVVEVRRLGGDAGTVTIAARADRRPTEDDLVLLDAAAARLGDALAGVRRDASSLRRRSLELAGRAAREAAGAAPAAGLRPRERAILRLYAEGLRTDEIAELLVLSPHTVRTHVRNARRRLGVGSRGEVLELLESSAGDAVV